MHACALGRPYPDTEEEPSSTFAVSEWQDRTENAMQWPKVSWGRKGVTEGPLHLRGVALLRHSLAEAPLVAQAATPAVLAPSSIRCCPYF